MPVVGRPPLGQVQDLLLGDGERRQVDEAAHQGPEPGADGDDGNRGGEFPVGGADQGAPGLRGLDAGRGRAGMDRGTVRGRAAQHGGDGAVGVEDAGFGVVQDRIAAAVEGESRPAFGRLARMEKLGGHAAPGENPVELPGVANRAEVQAAGDGDELLPGLLLQFPPEFAGPSRHRDVQRVGVHATENPGAAVRTAVPVAGFERFQDDDVQAAPCRCPGGGAARQPGADDD